MKNIILISSCPKKKITNLVKDFKLKNNIKIIDTKDRRSIIYFEKNYKNYDYLISFLNGYIIKKKQLNHFGNYKKINFHPATPEYRGRDTHHFACFNQEKSFGATLHFLNKKFDNGKIISIKKNKIKKNLNYKKYFEVATISAEFLFKKYFLLFIKDKIKPSKKKWSGKIYTRKKFLEMMEIKTITKDIKNKIKSFYTPEFNSLFIKVDNKKYYLRNFDEN